MLLLPSSPIRHLPKHSEYLTVCSFITWVLYKDTYCVGLHIYMYMYMYKNICMCICVCVYIYHNWMKLRYVGLILNNYSYACYYTVWVTKFVDFPGGWVIVAHGVSIRMQYIANRKITFFIIMKLFAFFKNGSMNK